MQWSDDGLSGDGAWTVCQAQRANWSTQQWRSYSISCIFLYAFRQSWGLGAVTRPVIVQYVVVLSLQLIPGNKPWDNSFFIIVCWCSGGKPGQSKRFTAAGEFTDSMLMQQDLCLGFLLNLLLLGYLFFTIKKQLI